MTEFYTLEQRNTYRVAWLSRHKLEMTVISRSHFARQLFETTPFTYYSIEKSEP